MAKKTLSKSDIFSNKGMSPKTVHVPEWGGDVRYKPMSMLERREVRKKSTDITTKDGETNVNVDTERLEVYAVVTCVLNPDSDSPMFNMDDVSVLEKEMTAGGVSTVAQAILRDSGMTGGAAFRGEEDS